MLARALAGEAGVHFYAASASEFVEKYVGVGASRVRELFKRATANAPSVIFLDELDAIGVSRGSMDGNGEYFLQRLLRVQNRVTTIDVRIQRCG